MSYKTRYAAAMRQRAAAAASTPAAAAARLRLQDALRRAARDAAERFPTLSAENVGAALDYQDERITYWRKELDA